MYVWQSSAKSPDFFFLRRRMSSNDPDAGSEESTGQHETRDQSAIKRPAQPYKRDNYPDYTNQEEREQEREREHTANGRYKRRTLGSSPILTEAATTKECPGPNGFHLCFGFQ